MTRRSAPRLGRGSGDTAHVAHLTAQRQPVPRNQTRPAQRPLLIEAPAAGRGAPLCTLLDSVPCTAARSPPGSSGSSSPPCSSQGRWQLVGPTRSFRRRAALQARRRTSRTTRAVTVRASMRPTARCASSSRGHSWPPHGRRLSSASRSGSPRQCARCSTENHAPRAASRPPGHLPSPSSSAHRAPMSAPTKSEQPWHHLLTGR